MPAFVRPHIRLLLLCLAGQVVWLSCDACEMSISRTDDEARRRELDEIEHRNWYEAEKRRWERYEAWHNTPVQRRYKKRFAGKIVPGVGCDVCPEHCKIWDLRSMDPEAFKQRFRAAVQKRIDNLDDRVASELLANELSRLGCIAAADAEHLTPALQALMAPEEEYLVRLEASSSLSFHKLDPAADAAFGALLRRWGEPLDAGMGDAHANAQ